MVRAIDCPTSQQTTGECEIDATSNDIADDGRRVLEGVGPKCYILHSSAGCYGGGDLSGLERAVCVHGQLIRQRGPVYGGKQRQHILLQHILPCS